MMRQYFENLAAEVGASEILLVGDKAILPSFDRQTPLAIAFGGSSLKKNTKTTTSKRKFENAEEDFAPSFPMRKLSSGSLSSKSSYDYSSSTKNEPLFNSRWVSAPPLTRSKSVSPVSTKRRSHRTRKLSDDLSIEIKSVILGDNNNNNNASNEEEEEQEQEPSVRLSPVAPQRKQSIEDCSMFLAAALSLRRTKSAELEAQVPLKLHSRWSATDVFTPF